MFSTLLSCLLFLLTTATPAASLLLGDRRETHEFRLVAVKENQLIVKTKDGKEQRLRCPPDVKVTAGDKLNLKLTDLKPGENIKVTTVKKGDSVVVIKIEAMRDRKR